MMITKDQARLFLLKHQELLNPRKLLGKQGILEYIKKVGCIQFDPLNMVGYNPYLVLQSRVKNFKSESLTELLYSDRKLLDGWDKNMSIYSIDDWPYFSRFRERSCKRYGDESKPINQILSQVRKELRERGPLSSIDLKFDTKVDWAWAPTRASRAALESMYYWGELIIHSKVGTRKIYDFTEKYLQEELFSMPDPNVTMEEYFEWNMKRRIGAVGLLWGRASDAFLGIRDMKSKERAEAIMVLEKRGELLQVEVEDIKYPIYIRSEESALLDQVIEGIDFEPEASFIAPLDNLLWDRKLIKEIFDFEYIWEVYKPIDKREFGYYVLPVLYGDRFVARFEPRFNRKTGKLELINWWWESDVVVTAQMKKALNKCFEHFMNYLGTSEFVIDSDSKTTKDLRLIEEIIN
ncbi:crosslink repair DNA glycosylase YcaQ family protein [Wukongibacter baidiensis]|uniref:winged helix-turn-helix domain-containing protein n=1 Tax=Wukongibacter baidiensis TaxID=1723361 RepID=UPI003D7F8A6E